MSEEMTPAAGTFDRELEERLVGVVAALHAVGLPRGPRRHERTLETDRPLLLDHGEIEVLQTALQIGTAGIAQGRVSPGEVTSLDAEPAKREPDHPLGHHLAAPGHGGLQSIEAPHHEPPETPTPQ